jgi:hypothetical protein
MKVKKKTYGTSVLTCRNTLMIHFSESVSIDAHSMFQNSSPTFIL